MRKIAKIAALLAAFGLALFAAGCSNSSDPLPYIPSGGSSGGGGGGGGEPTAKTIDLSTVTADTVIANNTTVTGTLGANVKISIADGATVTLKDVKINGTDSDSYKWAGLTCAGGATINLEGTNTVKGFLKYYPGLFVPKGKTLTIKGSGSLAANSNGYGAGIGGCYAVDSSSHIPKEEGSCGTIVIEGGTITATGGMSAGIGCSHGSDCDGVTITGGTVTATGGTMAAGIGSGGGNSVCGPISISGGTVTAEGGDYAAGVGTGYLADSKCGAITVANTVTKFTATKGSGATDSVGHGQNGGACGAVTICGTVYWDGSAYQNEGATVLGQSPYTYPKIVDLSKITADTVIQDGYTVIGSTTAGKKIQIADGATVTLKGINIKCSTYKVNGIECLGTATLILEGTNKVETTKQDYAAIYAGPSGKTLTIKGDGSLTVKAYNYGAAIGSNTSNTVSGTVCGNITIESGTIVATSGANAAAIGAGSKGQCGNIVISGGTVTANASAYNNQSSGAAIGTGTDKVSSCGTITISGDNTKVTATRPTVESSGQADCIGKGQGTWTLSQDQMSGSYVRPTCGTVTIGEETGYKTEASYTYNPSGR